MNSRILLIIDAVLFAAVCVLLYIVLTTAAETPPEAPDFLARDGEPGATAAETTYVVSFAHLGTRDIFGVPVPIPPPPPPPPPAPPAPPNLDAILMRLTINQISGDEAEFQDSLDGSVHVVHAGELVGLTGESTAQTIQLRITQIDDQDFRIHFELEWPDFPTQTGSRGMFEEDDQ